MNRTLPSLHGGSLENRLSVPSKNKTFVYNVYIYIYELPIAGQTAGPIRLNFLRRLMSGRVIG